MIVIAVRDYNSLNLHRMVRAGEELEVTNERAEVLLTAGVCKLKPTTTTEVGTKPAPKKKAPKKKEAKTE